MQRLLAAALLISATVMIDSAPAQPPPKGKFDGKKGPEGLFRLIDRDADGKISFDEFKRFSENAPRFKDKGDQLRTVFDRADVNKDGFLSMDEFRKMSEQFPGGDKGKSKPKPKEETSSAFNEKPTAEQMAFFEKKIRPVLVDNCYQCHSAEAKKLKANLLLDTRDGTRKGGDTGPALVAGDPDRSLMIKALKSKDESQRMPPKAPLPDSVIDDFVTWIKMGAPDPRSGDGKAIAKNEIDIEKGRQFWAFQRPKKSTPPKIEDDRWSKNEVDQFIKAGLEEKGLKPVAAADERTLLRRLYLDLIGLPPTPEEVESFVHDRSPKKIEKVVDKLLDSPHFGERWGRHWLDVARYAESTGKSTNFSYPHAWRYRDYVINSFNIDKPFDMFVKEQLAGDLLPAKDDADRAENIVATGFLAIGTKGLNERNRLQYELDVADEQIDTFSQAFLGVTAACARCHDHKFDPIPMKDYYSLAGIFRSTETCYGTIRLIQSNYPSPLVTLPGCASDGIAPLSKREREQLERQLKSLKDEFSSMTGKSKGDVSVIRNRVQTSTLEAKLNLYDDDGAPKKLAMGVREKSRINNSPVFARGEPDKPGEVVQRGVLQVVGNEQPAIRNGSGRRELAEWVASKNNPLTARVWVNRVWLHLFGRGIVPTPDNFGASGLPPANQALLDNLAVSLMDDGWSTKKLIKRLVLTQTYQLSTKSDEANLEADPDNALCWRMTPSRLDAEVVRDCILAASGRLDTTPAKGSAVARQGEGISIPRGPGFRQSPNAGGGSEDTHRSVYMPIVRDNLPEALSLFDTADPSFVTGERMNTTVPAQALFLMNNSFVIRHAEAAGERIRDLASSDRERINHAYLTFFGRTPSDAELKNAIEFLDSYGKKTRPRESWTALCQAFFASAEFLFRN